LIKIKIKKFEVNEVQKIICHAYNGTFYLKFRENSTLPISYNASAAMLQLRLEQIYTLVLIIFIYIFKSV
jgi:hypothetical protein